MKIQLLHGDCIERMAEMPEGSVGDVTCDPPYGLKFMGKAFDDLGDGTLQRLWHQKWLEHAFRVLAPGGILKAFGGTRVFHHLAAAMEDVGFVDVGLKAWGYGCLSEDSEILTEDGWKPGLEVQVGEKVACWDPDTGSISLMGIEGVTQSRFEGEMAAFVNDNTDQLLTPNHRIYKKHRVRKMANSTRVETEEEHWTAEQAVTINRWDHIRLPLAGIHKGPGIGGEDWAAFLAWVWTEGGYDTVGDGIRICQSSVNMEHVHEIQRLMDICTPKHKRHLRDRSYKNQIHTEYTWLFTGHVARRIREILPAKRPTWELLWGMTQDEKHAFVNAAVAGNGTRGPGGAVFHQKNPEDLVWFQTLAHLMNRQGRINFQKSVVGLHMNPTTQLQSSHLQGHVSELYKGMVWCVQVPTGAFIARRKDKVFITGNSGFPKSLDVSKSLDKMHGAVRGTVKTPFTGNALMRAGGQNTRPWMEEALRKGFHEAANKEPVTDDAKMWSGWGTALKPAWEPILVGRKPGDPNQDPST